MWSLHRATCRATCRFFSLRGKILDLYLAVVLEDVGGGREVQHPVDDQLTESSQLYALPLMNSYLHLLVHTWEGGVITDLMWRQTVMKDNMNKALAQHTVKYKKKKKICYSSSLSKQDIKSCVCGDLGDRWQSAPFIPRRAEDASGGVCTHCKKIP